MFSIYMAKLQFAGKSVGLADCYISSFARASRSAIYTKTDVTFSAPHIEVCFFFLSNDRNLLHTKTVHLLPNVVEFCGLVGAASKLHHNK